MAEDDLGKVFDKKAAPLPVMEAETYRRLLERLLREGKGYGKTKPVAAYLMTDIKFDRTDEKGNLIEKEKIEVKPAYIIMDLKYLPDMYSQWVTVKDIMVQYMKRTLGLNDINNSDFKGPEVWTAKPSAFAKDYIRREDPPDAQEAPGTGSDGAETSEDGPPRKEEKIHIYDPNPESRRLALTVENNGRMPTQWGDWPLEAGGAIAVAERDIPELAAALQSIRDGNKTIEDALYVKGEDGKMLAKFDVYGMSPRFLPVNYDPVTLKPETEDVLEKFRTALPSTPAAAAPKNRSPS